MYPRVRRDILHLQYLLLQEYLVCQHRKPRTVPIDHPDSEVRLIQSQYGTVVWWNQLAKPYALVFVDNGLHQSIVSSVPVGLVAQSFQPLRLP